MNSTLPTATPTGTKCLSLPEVARRLGISPRSVYRLLARGELPPALKFGGATRLLEADLEAFIVSRKLEAARNWPLPQP
jgi:excisionase family DNA binding protein